MDGKKGVKLGQVSTSYQYWKEELSLDVIQINFLSTNLYYRNYKKKDIGDSISEK